MKALRSYLPHRRPQLPANDLSPDLALRRWSDRGSALALLLARAGIGLPLVAALALSLAGCLTEPAETTRQRITDSHRQHAYERCLANSALENYIRQCRHIGAKIRVERRTYICEAEGRRRNPSEMGDGPFCVCHERGESGACVGEADCDGGIHEKCDAVLTAELIPYFDREKWESEQLELANPLKD